MPFDAAPGRVLQVVSRSERAGIRSPLPFPVNGGSLAQLRSLINVADDDFVLIVGCLLNGFRGGRSHPVLVLTGAAAKSTQLAILDRLIDPQPIGGLPATERQLRKVSDRHLFAFDNVPRFLDRLRTRCAGFRTPTL
jgi:hypothetical protein